MSRILAVLLAVLLGGCGGAASPGAPALTAEQLREGAVASTLDVLVGAVDLFAAHDDQVAEIIVRGEPVTLFATLAPDGAGMRMTVAADGLCSTEALLELAPDPDRGLAIAGTLRTESKDGVVVTATLEQVFAQAAADLPGLETGVVFTSGEVDLGVHAGERLLATGTAALYGRSALVALSVRGASSTGEIDLGR